jgi:ribosomal protein L6P/L9E
MPGDTKGDHRKKKGALVKRRKLPHGKDKKIFSKQAKPHIRNMVQGVMRGGIRF